MEHRYSCAAFAERRPGMKLTPPHFAKRTRLLGPVPLTPLVDVVFLLLIYFLLTTTNAIPESALSPALQAITVSGGTPSDLEPQVIEIERLPSGETVYRIGSRSVSTHEALLEILRVLPKEAGVFVRATPEVRVDALAAALQACNDAGFTGVTYVPGAGR